MAEHTCAATAGYAVQASCPGWATVNYYGRAGGEPFAQAVRLDKLLCPACSLAVYKVLQPRSAGT